MALFHCERETQEQQQNVDVTLTETDNSITEEERLGKVAKEKKKIYHKMHLMEQRSEKTLNDARTELAAMVPQEIEKQEEMRRETKSGEYNRESQGERSPIYSASR